MDRSPEAGRPRLRVIWRKVFAEARKVWREGGWVEGGLARWERVGEYNGEHVLEEFDGVVCTDCYFLTN